MKKPTRKPKHRRAPVNMLVSGLERFAALPRSKQKRLLEDIIADRQSEEPLQDVRDEIAQAIDECMNDGGQDAMFVLWGYPDED
jgi:hypothetical protein